MDIKKFLKKHPLISVSGLERKCGIPHGTIRLTSKRDIPKKYLGVLAEVLVDYGYVSSGGVSPKSISTGVPSSPVDVGSMGPGYMSDLLEYCYGLTYHDAVNHLSVLWSKGDITLDDFNTLKGML